MVKKFPNRLWASATNLNRRRSTSPPKKEMPFPLFIEIETDVVKDKDDEPQRRNKKDELKFWKGKAQALEGVLEKLEEKVTALEKESKNGSSRGGHDDGDHHESLASSSKTEEASMARSSSTAPVVPNVPAAPPSPPSSQVEKKGEKSAENENQRKDAIMQQLVSEMERLIKFHASQIAVGNSKSHNEKNTGDHMDSEKGADVDKDPDKEANNNAESSKDSSDNSDDSNDKNGAAEELDCTSHSTPPSRAHSKIETSTLEELVSKILATEKNAMTAASVCQPVNPKRRKKKSDHVLYQLSCKRCICQTFVGSTKNNLKDKVKENYAVVWQVVQTAYGKGGDEGPEEKDQKDLEQSLAFRASSFVHHVAKHCKEHNTEEEVYNWCLKNIKVEQIRKNSMLGA